MKGITPVIAVILLLLITISLVGFAFLWFTRLSSSAQESVSGQLNATTSGLAKKIRIDNVAGTAVSLRNIGTADVGIGDLAFFIDGSPAVCTIAGTWPISPSSIGQCTLAPACNGTQRFRVSAPAGPDEVTCPFVAP